jgi:hypothetical protein
MVEGLSRRGFLQVAGLALGGLAVPPVPTDPSSSAEGIGRVAASWVSLYAEPSFRSRRLTTVTRDVLLTLLESEAADEGPTYNPLWYRAAEGYVHSGNLQLVRWNPQLPETTVPPDGALFEVSVPFTRSYREPDPSSDPLYRLYFQAVFWVQSVLTGADGRRWYRILDDRLRVPYFVRAEHLRRVPPEEVTPVAPDVPARNKRIEVSIARQELRAFEHDELVLRTRISSGVPSRGPSPNGIPTETPSGSFHVEIKTPSRHMGDGYLTPDLEAYELPGVPWVSFFHSTGVGFHGTYWHTDFGRMRSHGCVNMRTDEAKWLYRWTMPLSEPDKLLISGHGTLVVVE